MNLWNVFTLGINRASVTLTLCIALAPVLGFAFLSPTVRSDASEALERAIERASKRMQGGTVYELQKQEAIKTLEQTNKRLSEISYEKRSVRLHIAALRRAIAELRIDHGIDVSDPTQASIIAQSEKDELRSFVRYLHAKRVANEESGPMMGDPVLKRTLFASLGDTVDENLADRALERARARLLTLVLDAQDLPITLAALEARHEQLLSEYSVVSKEQAVAQSQVQLNESQLAEIKRTVEEVQSQVLSLQGELARIDARLRDQAERTLAEKGLWIPGDSDAEGDDGIDETFSWPVYGPITAGYFEPSYKAHFGVSHYGIDIAVPQSTVITAASDGVVFTARDAGMGYSYILIGHRDGYATIYGHVSRIDVAAGQEVRRGEAIGLSGGRPGSPGAGLMTTGSHVHFEVVKDGVHVNPQSVLP